MKLDLILSTLLVLPLAACDQKDTDLGELESETNSMSSASESDSGSESESGPQTTGESESDSETATTGESESDSESESETDSGSSGGGLFPAACEAAGWVESYEAFQAASASGNYSYVVEEVTFIELGDFQCLYNTTITVESGEVVRRAFELIDQIDGAQCEQDFIETAETLGSSDVPVAHPPITMDEVYLACCENQLDLPAEDWTPNFLVDEAGLLAHCSTAMTNCGDGCTQGGAGDATVIEYTFE